MIDEILDSAELYPSDSDYCPWLEEEKDAVFYQSRGSVPVAWFFFFRPQELVYFDAIAPETCIREVFFIAPKAEALFTFQERQDILMRVIGDDFDSAAKISGLIDTVATWPGQYLVVDPNMVEDYGQLRGHYELILKYIDAIFWEDRPYQHFQYLLAYLKGSSKISYDSADDFAASVIGNYHSGSSGSGEA